MNTEALLKFLSRIPYFNGIDEESLFNLAARGKFVKFNKDTAFINQNDTGSSLYLIFAGKVKVRPGSAGISRTLDRLDYFGELSFFDGGAREIDAYAETDTVLFEITRESFFDFIKNNNKASLKIIANLGGELRREKSSLKRQGVTEENPIGIPVYDTHSEAGKEPEEMYYQKEFKCPYCGSSFSTTKVKSKFARVVKMDDDLYNHYEPVNPLFYEINVCPRCGYSFNDENSGPISDKARDEIEKVLATSRRKKDFCGMRNIDLAVESFKLAIICQMARRVRDSQKGMLYLKLGWLYRASNDQENENICRGEAVKFLTSSFEKESFNDQKSEINIMYLIGVLNRMMGNYKEAAVWLDRVLRHPMRRSYSGVVNRARENWHALREEMKKQPGSAE